MAETEPIATDAWQQSAPPVTAKPKTPLWTKLTTAGSVLLLIIAIAGFVIHVPYTTISPGEAVQLAPKVTVAGGKSYMVNRGDIRLLFVRERYHVNLWRFLLAHLDTNTDIIADQAINPGNESPERQNQEAEQNMADAKVSATKVALEAAGYTVKTIPGLTASGFTPHFPAEKVLDYGDILLTADGTVLKTAADLTRIINSKKVGDTVRLGITRDGKPMTVDVGIAKLGDRKVIGIEVSPRFKFPITVNVDTSQIGGPSAGLAMSLAILDALTPGDLTGGHRIAVTGTIDNAGGVGEIGGIEQKAVAARAAGAQIFIVPRCSPSDPQPYLKGCQDDLARATARVGKHVQVRPVATFQQALDVLREAGGAPVKSVAPSTVAA